jgi:hypothetical protein
MPRATLDAYKLGSEIHLDTVGVPPLISSDGGGPTAALTADENTTAVTTVTADDPDSTTITYSIADGIDARALPHQRDDRRAVLQPRAEFRAARR